MNSVFNIFKIGIGPSSSHTVGPMKAGKLFIDELINSKLIDSTTQLIVDIYGSLSLTGKGHLTDIAIILGLAGNQPDTVDVDNIDTIIEEVKKTGKLSIYHDRYITNLPFERNLHFHRDFLTQHENAMTLSAYNNDCLLLKKTYFSVGGGEIVEEKDFDKEHVTQIELPYPFTTAAQLLAYCEENALPISNIMMKNELKFHTNEEIKTYFSRVNETMNECIKRGITTDGLLPGPVKTSRRASTLYRQLASTADKNLITDPMIVIDWVNLYAFAVSEENAAGHRVVTAPTNGACGIIPAVLAYYNKFIETVTPDIYLRYFLTCGAIGQLYQVNASISGAAVGCQGEVGVACSMAAAGLAELLGANSNQVCIAAEIAMEHNLGLTCDPVGGQVQIPCIERNAIAAVKAINAARMALRRTSGAKVSLDAVIKTMYQTGKDMDPKYKETSTGGLAVFIPTCH